MEEKEKGIFFLLIHVAITPFESCDLEIFLKLENNGDDKGCM